jgi:hypothetical protein
MQKLLSLLQSLSDQFTEFGRNSTRSVIKPLLLMAVVAAGYAMVQPAEWAAFWNNLKSAFLGNEMQERLREQAMLQAELRQFAAANKLIDQLLATMLERATGASRVRLNVIHNGVTGLTGTGLLRYDMTNAAAAPGRLAGSTITNQPLSEWSDFLPALISGQCSFHYVADLRAVSLRARFEASGATGLLVCPAADVQGRIVGSIFILWDGADMAPAGSDLRELMAVEQQLGAQIAAVLDLQGALPEPSKAQDME